MLKEDKELNEVNLIEKVKDILIMSNYHNPIDISDDLKLAIQLRLNALKSLNITINASEGLTRQIRRNQYTKLTEVENAIFFF